MVLFNDLLSFPFVLLNKNWGERETLLSKKPRACAVRAETWVCSDLKYGEILQTVVSSGPDHVASLEHEGLRSWRCQLGCLVGLGWLNHTVGFGVVGSRAGVTPLANSTGGTVCPHHHWWQGYFGQLRA